MNYLVSVVRSLPSSLFKHRLQDIGSFGLFAIIAFLRHRLWILVLPVFFCHHRFLRHRLQDIGFLGLLSHRRFLGHSLRILDLAFSKGIRFVRSSYWIKSLCWLDMELKKNKKLTDIGLLQLFNDLGFQLFLVYQDFWI